MTGANGRTAKCGLNLSKVEGRNDRVMRKATAATGRTETGTAEATLLICISASQSGNSLPQRKTNGIVRDASCMSGADIVGTCG